MKVKGINMSKLELITPEESLRRRMSALTVEGVQMPVETLKVPQNFSLASSEPLNTSEDDDIRFAPNLKAEITNDIKGEDRGEVAPPTDGANPDLKYVTGQSESLIELLGKRESNGNYNPKINPYGYIGKYQMGGGALETLGYKDEDGKWTGKDGLYSSQDFIDNPEAQEEIMIAHTEHNRRALIHFGVDKWIGQVINGEMITLGGMQAIAHNQGATNAIRIVDGAFDKVDGFGTTGWSYLVMYNKNFGINQKTMSPDAPPVTIDSVPKGFGLGVHGYEDPDWVSERDMQLMVEASQNIPIGTQIAAVVDARWFGNSAARWLAINNRDITPDPDWSMDMDRRVELSAEYTEKEMETIRQSVSEQDLNYKKFDIQMARERSAKAAMVGLPVSLITELFDPMGVLLSFATAGLYRVNQATRLGNALKTGSLVSLEEMALESFKVSNDTSANWREVLMAGAGAYVIGSPIGAFRKGQIQVDKQIKLEYDQKERFAKVIRDKASLQQYKLEKEKLVSKQSELGSYKLVMDDVRLQVADVMFAADGNVMDAARLQQANSTIDYSIKRLDLEIEARQADIDRQEAWFSGNESNILDRKAKKVITKENKVLAKELETLVVARDTEFRDFHAKAGTPDRELMDVVTRDQSDRILAKHEERITAVERQLASNMERLQASKGNKRAKETRGTGNPIAIARAERRAIDEAIHKHDKDINVTKVILENNRDLLKRNDELVQAKRLADKVNAMSEAEQAVHFNSKISAEEIASLNEVKAQLKKITEEQSALEKSMKEKYITKADKLLGKVKPEGAGGDLSAAKTKGLEKDPDELFPDADQDISAMDDAVMEAAMARYVMNENTHGKNYTRFIPDFMLSDYTRINMSKDTGILSLSHLLLDNPQLGDAHTVSTLTSINDAQIRMAGQNSMDRGFDLHLSEDRKINAVSGHLMVKYREEFEMNVAFAIKSILPEAELTDAIKMARDGMRNLFKVAGSLRKLQREKGFEEFSAHANYLPDIMSAEAIMRLNDSGWGKDDIIGLLAKGYQTGGAKLTAKQAKVVAYIKYDSISQKFLSGEDVYHVFRADRVSDAKRLLNDANVPQDLIEEFFEEVFTKDDWATVSKRARKSLFIDWSAEYTNPRTGQTKRVSDIMDTNVSKLSEAYTIESAFGAALAEKGIKSEAQLYRIMDAVEKQAMNSNADKKQVRKHMAILKKTIPQLKGRPVVDYSNPINKFGRVALDSTAMLRLQQVGFASIPEFARIASELGVTEMLKAVKGSGMFRAPNWKNKSVTRDAQNKLKREFQLEMENIEEMIGYIGEADFNRSWNVRADDLGSEMSGSMAKNLDAALEGGRRIGSWLSLHQTVQGGLAKVSALGTSRRLLKAFNGSQELPRSLRNQIKMTGMSDARFKEISDFIKANGKTADFQGRKISVWNIEAFDKADGAMYRKRDKMLDNFTKLQEAKKELGQKLTKARKKGKDSDEVIELEIEMSNKQIEMDDLQIEIDKPVQSIQRDVQVLMQRLLNRSVLKGGVGDMNTSWLGPFGRFLTQFKTFSLNSLEKQLIADMRGDIASLPVKFAYGTGMAYAAYMAQMHLRALGMGDKEGEKYLKDTTEDPMKLFWGVFNKHSQLAAAGIVFDAGVFTGTLPKEFYDGSRYGYMNANVDAFVPVLGTAKDTMETIGAVTDVLGSITGMGSKTIRESLSDLKDESRDMTPFANTVIIGEYYDNLNK